MAEQTLGEALAMLDTIVEKGRERKQSIPLEQHLKLLRKGQVGVYRDEIIASRLMKHLTARFGTRGKTPKFVFLQAFEEELRGGNSSETEYLRSVGQDRTYFKDEQDADDDKDDEDIFSGRKQTLLQPKAKPKTMSEILTMRSGHLGPIIERPAALVSYSVFVHKLVSQLRFQIHRLGCSPPVFETNWLFEEIKPNPYDESMTFYDTLSVRDMLEEPEEALLKRLKLYKRAFSALILHLEAYVPVLRQIKKCYDHVLFVRERELQQAAILKQNIERFKITMEQRNLNVKFEGTQQLEEVQQQSVLLLRHIDKQEAAIRSMNEILNRLELQLSDEHDSRKDSEDQQKLLIVEINDYRKKLGMDPRPEEFNSDLAIEHLTGISIDLNLNLGEEEGTSEESSDDRVMPRDTTITVDDILILRKALEIARNDLKEAESRMEKMEVQNSNVIPRHQVLDLKQQVLDLESEHNNRKNTYEHLGSQVQGLKDQIEFLKDERARLTDQVGEVRTKLTPRPSWENFGEFIDGGIPRWKSLYEGKSSNDTAEKLFLELTIKKISGPLEYYSALGTTPKVPIYMRYDSRVRKRKLGRRDIAVMIHDIWQSRIDICQVVKEMEDAVELQEETLLQDVVTTTKSEIFGENIPHLQIFQEYFLKYFTTHYKNVPFRMEWIYNLIETSKKFQTIEPRFRLFLDILEGKKSENVYHLFRTQMSRLFSGLLHQSKVNGSKSGEIPLGLFSQTISFVFPYKTANQITRLTLAASKQCNVYAEWSIIKYKTFFTMTDEGFIGGFVNEFLKQLDEDVEAFAQDIIRYFTGEPSNIPIDLDKISTPDREITIAQFYKCLIKLDPNSPDERIGAAVSWAFIEEVCLPGTEFKIIRLLNLVRNNMPTADAPEFSDKVELEYERLVLDIKIKTEEDRQHGDSVTPQQKMAVKHSKRITLAQLASRLKIGGVVRFGLHDSQRSDEPRVSYYDDEEEGEDMEEDETEEAFESGLEGEPSNAADTAASK